MVDDRGTAVPFDAEATGWWDGAHKRIRWLLLTFAATTDRRYFFEQGVFASPPRGPPLATQEERTITVDTGPLVVRVGADAAPLFDDIRLNGRAMAEPVGLAFGVEIGFQKGRVETAEPVSWRVEIEENTALRTTLRARGELSSLNVEGAAALDVRAQFFRDESFVRVYHTLVWKVRNWRITCHEISLRLKPDLGPTGRLRVGTSDLHDQCIEMPWREASDLYVHQTEPARFLVTADGKERSAGEQIGGWVSLEGEGGRGVALCLRDAWQTAPTAFSFRGGVLAAEFWPARGKAMGFSLEDLLPEVIYSHPDWKRYPWSKEVGHATHEYAENPHYEHTPEGAARTHEVVVHFFDHTSKRTPAGMNSVTQHPVVIRQDPKHALRVPFLGFDIPAADARNYPIMEESIDTMGRLASVRWVEKGDYGFWVFGMMRWGNPDRGLYRWFDGLQYDTQVVPWVLYLRGGGRSFYEEGERTARYAMDVATNHYTTRVNRAYYTGSGVGASGFQGGAAISPFPWSSLHLHKAAKVHFLRYYYHLTGYRRAKDVLDEVMTGALWAAKHDRRGKDHPAHRNQGRELFNCAWLWANLYEETFDPRVKTYAMEWLDLTLGREYDPTRHVFRAPPLYQYYALRLHSRLWDVPELKAVLLDHLEALGYPDMPHGGVAGAPASVICGWAHEATDDRRYAQVAWDIARALADVTPRIDWSRPDEVRMPFHLTGNTLTRHYVMPMLVGLGLAHRTGLREDSPVAFRDTHIAINMAADSKPAKGRAYLRPRRDGDLTVMVSLRNRWGGRFNPVAIRVSDPPGNQVASTTAEWKPRLSEQRFYPISYHGDAHTLAIPKARKGAIYVVDFEGADGQLTVLLDADADVVIHVPLTDRLDFQNLSGQSASGARVYSRTTSDTVTFGMGHRSPFSIRDARTWELLYKAPAQPPETFSVELGRDRLIAICVHGYANIMQIRSGLAPYYATVRDGWFEPE